MLTFTVSVKRFESVARRRRQVTQAISIIQVDQFTSRRFLNGERQLARSNALEDFFCFRVGERLNHT